MTASVGNNSVPVADDVIEFLQQSNFIEGVIDGDSLDQAVIAWQYLVSQKQLTKQVILKTHKILMLHQSIRPDEKGYFRQRGVWIGGREGLHYSQIPDTIEQWLHIANLTDTAEFPAEWAKQSHVQYERIHPFIDGNGRTGRMFLNWQRLQAGLPILIIREEDRFEYYDWFK